MTLSFHAMRPVVMAATRVLICASLLLGSPGCAIRRMALNSLATTLSASGDTFSSDDDPALVRDAVPFALKTYESLLASLPRHRGLLLATCSGFTQYSYAFVQTEADRLEPTDYAESLVHRERALKLYLRGRDYCLRALEVARPGIVARLNRNPADAVASFTKADVPLLYWTAASWGKAVSLSLDKPELAGDFPIVRALAARALALDETYNRGALHEIMITLESVPEAMGGSRERARQHFDRAVTLSNGMSAGAYVSYATGVLLPQQKKDEFVQMLQAAVAIDPDREPSLRLANLITQQYARYLLEHLEDLFISNPTAAAHHVEYRRTK